MNVGSIPARPAVTRTTDLFGWLQCTDCSKWRRVSAQALRIWGENFHESHKSRCKALLQGDAVLDGLAARALTFDVFVDELREWTKRRSESLCARTVLLVALELLQAGPSPMFREQHDEAQEAYTGAAFRCDELVGCACALDCDTRVFHNDERDTSDWNGKPVLCLDVAEDQIFYGTAKTQGAMASRATSSCEACSTGQWTYEAAPDSARSRNDKVKVKPLCTMHKMRLVQAAKKGKQKRLRLSQVHKLLGTCAQDSRGHASFAGELLRDGDCNSWTQC